MQWRLPEYIRSDNAAEFTAVQIHIWLEKLGVGALFTEPGLSWVNGKFWYERFIRESFTTLAETKVAIEQWRKENNEIRPQSAAGYKPPVPETVILLPLDFATLHPAAIPMSLS